MFKSMLAITAVTLAVLAPAAAAQAVGPDAAACRSGSDRTALVVNVSGLKAPSGRLRVQLYGNNPADFLAKGKYVRRIDLPVSSEHMAICVEVPRPGRYAVAVRHDVDGNGKKSDWSDGGGFSRNTKISLFHLKPDYSSVAVNVNAGVTAVNVLLNYRRGLSIGPLNG
jgi:uncharacterized protein (DUF2141 family)